MKHGFYLLALALAIAPASAQVTESGDAPQGHDGTQDATGATTTISGTITASTDFADCYAITIGDIDGFSASTFDAGTSGDTQLFLFDASLEGIVFNDDVPDGLPGDDTLTSTIPAGSLTGLGLSPGTYVLCVSDWDQDPLNVLDEEIFPQSPFAEVHVPNAASGDYVLDDWNSSAIDARTYVINLTGTAPPEPVFEISINTFTNNPMRGESVFFRGPVSNTGDATGDVYVYAIADIPGGQTYQRNLGRVTLGPGQSFKYKNFQNAKNYIPLPFNSPEGTYTVTVYAASDRFGTEVYDTDSFQFTLGPVALPTLASLPENGAASLEAVEPGAAPNPFRDATTITYAVVEDAPVSLRVYDVMGREVADLVSGTQAAGTHTATLRAGDLPSGTYIWRLSVGGEMTTGRITLSR